MSTAAKKNVIVIGLSAAGAQFAGKLEKVLPSSHRIIGINKEEYGYFCIAALRASVLPDWEKHVTIDLSKLFENKDNVLMAGTTVTAISPTHVTIDKDHAGFSREIPYDALVVATGANYGFPGRPRTEEASVESAHRRFKEKQEQIARATSVLVVGGGAAGCELAAEIAWAYPKKKVTLVHAHDHLHSSLFTKKTNKRLLERLRAHNIEVILNTRAKVRQGVDGLVEKQSFELDNGEKINADFVANMTGNTPNTGLMRDLDPSILDERGYIKVKTTLQLDTKNPELERIFAIGDCTQTQGRTEWKNASNAMNQATHAAKNIVSLINGSALEVFPPSKIFGCIALGPEDGVMEIPIFGGTTFGTWASKKFKSEKLYLTAVAPHMFNIPPPKDFPNKRPA